MIDIAHQIIDTHPLRFVDRDRISKFYGKLRKRRQRDAFECTVLADVHIQKVKVVALHPHKPLFFLNKKIVVLDLFKYSSLSIC